MKKVCSLICLSVLFLSMVLPACAEETINTEDSVTISEDVLSQLNASEEDTVLRIYDFGHNYDGFAAYDDIDEVITNPTASGLHSYYLVKDKQGEISAYTHDGGHLSETPYWGAGWFRVHGNRAQSVIKVISADIVVKHIYYLEYTMYSAVYYKTNLGDYVYVIADESYLMALDPFLALHNELRDQVFKLKDSYNLLGQSSEVKFSDLRVDLSPYDITSPDFDPHAPLKTHFKPGKFIAIGSFALLVTLVVCRCLIRGHRKYRKKKERMAYHF